MCRGEPNGDRPPTSPLLGTLDAANPAKLCLRNELLATAWPPKQYLLAHVVHLLTA